MSRDEQETFVAFFNTFKLSRQLETFTDLYDGRALFEVSSVKGLRALLKDPQVMSGM